MEMLFLGNFKKRLVIFTVSEPEEMTIEQKRTDEWAEQTHRTGHRTEHIKEKEHMNKTGESKWH